MLHWLPSGAAEAEAAAERQLDWEAEVGAALAATWGGSGGGSCAATVE